MGEDLASSWRRRWGLRSERCIKQTQGVPAEEREHHVQRPWGWSELGVFKELQILGMVQCDSQGVRRRSNGLSGLRRPYGGI